MDDSQAVMDDTRCAGIEWVDVSPTQRCDADFDVQARPTAEPPFSNWPPLLMANQRRWGEWAPLAHPRTVERWATGQDHQVDVRAHTGAVVGVGPYDTHSLDVCSCCQEVAEGAYQVLNLATPTLQPRSHAVSLFQHLKRLSLEVLSPERQNEGGRSTRSADQGRMFR
jgi:hypothetical protein